MFAMFGDSDVSGGAFLPTRTLSRLLIPGFRRGYFFYVFPLTSSEGLSSQARARRTCRKENTHPYPPSESLCRGAL